MAVAACSSLKRLVIMLVMMLVMTSVMRMKRMMMVLMSMVHAHNVHHTLPDVLSESKEAYMPLYSNLNVENDTQVFTTSPW